MKNIKNFEEFINEKTTRFKEQVWNDSVYDAFKKLTKEQKEKIRKNLRIQNKNYLFGISFDELDPQTKKDVWKEMKNLGVIKESEEINEGKSKIVVDTNKETTTLKLNDGVVQIGNLYDENGLVDGMITLYAKSYSSHGFTEVKIKDFIKLIKTFQNEGWDSAGKII